MLKNIIKTKRYVVVQTKLAILSIKKKFKPIKINIKKRVELKKTRNKKLIKLMKAGFTRWIKSIKLDLKKKTKEERIKHNNYKARRSRKLARFWIKKSNEAEKQVKELKERKKKRIKRTFY